jgi:glycosyltransferase involved in cell wall biosynthesis
MKIVWVKTELLHPVDKGGKIRTYHMLKELKRHHHITYVTLDDGMAAQDARARAEEYCHELIAVPHFTREKFTAGFYADLAFNVASSLPYAIKKYMSPQHRQQIIACVEKARPDLLVCDFLAPSVNVPEKIGCATVLFQHNVEAMIWKRHGDVQTNPVKKLYLQDQWRKMFAYERDACRRFDHVVAVSAQDSEVMRREYGLGSVTDIPTGVDTHYFSSNGQVEIEPYNLVFTGSMDWLPNEDAIRYFIEQVLPLVKKSVPGATLTVVGRNPHPRLLELSHRDSSIIVTGRVEDVRPYMERAAAYVVPLRIGGGTRLKIFEAMAMEKAVISTSIGAEGLPVRSGEDLLIADEPQGFADAVTRVLTDEIFRRKISKCAAATVRNRFGWAHVAECFAEACLEVVQARSARNAARFAEGKLSQAV